MPCFYALVLRAAGQRLQITDAQTPAVPIGMLLSPAAGST